MHPQKPREIAARILLRHQGGRAFIEKLTDDALAHYPGPAADRALVQELCFGVVRWQAALDWLIQRKAHRKPPGAGARTLLRLGLYQLFWLDRIPAHAAVNETVSASHALGLTPDAGFLNAVLRNYSRELEPTRAALTVLRQEDPATGWSHPPWLVERWRNRFDAHQLESLLAWDNQPARPYARVNTLKIDPGRLLERWRDEDVAYDFGRWEWIPENLVFCLRSHPPIARLKTFRDGWFYLQDPSTLLAVEMLDPKPGELIIDLCAAPGGKTTYLAQKVGCEGRIVAVEPDARRRELLSSNCERLAATCVQVIPIEQLAALCPAGSADAVLVDVPCSNTGVLRRRVDVRWRLNGAEFERLQVRQSHLLETAAEFVRPGGRLIYSTCSLEPEENEGQTVRFLADRPLFRLERQRQLLPPGSASDGAYAARLLRTHA